MLTPEPTLSIGPSSNELPPAVTRIVQLPSFNLDNRTRAPPQIIELLIKRNAKIHSEGEKLLAQLAVLETQRREVGYRVFKARATISPWLRLPNEILIIIFKIVLRGDPDMVADITFACKRWRLLTLGAPSLWTGLRITKENEKSLKKIKVFAEKSGEMPLRIFYRQDPFVGVSGWECWVHLLSLSKRWESISLDFLNVTYATQRLRSLLPMQNLQELSVQVREHVDHASNDDRFKLDELVEASVPKLASLTVKDFLPPLILNSCWTSQLRKLHIVDRFRMTSSSTESPMKPLDIVFVLGRCVPMLQEFIFESPNSGDYWGNIYEPTEQLPTRRKPLNLPILKRLELTCAAPVIEAILRSTSMYTLEKLHIGTAITLTTSKRDAEFQVRRASDAVALLLIDAKRLESVSIEGLSAKVFPSGSPRHILSKVEYLHINNVEPLCTVLSLLENVQRAGSKNPYWYAPTLRHLELSYFAHDVEHLHASFCNIVRERWYHSRLPVKKVAPLETLILSGENLVENPSTAQMRAFKSRFQSKRT